MLSTVYTRRPLNMNTREKLSAPACTQHAFQLFKCKTENWQLVAKLPLSTSFLGIGKSTSPNECRKRGCVIHTGMSTLFTRNREDFAWLNETE